MCAEQVNGVEKAHAETRAAFENRALVYKDLFDVLADEFGHERAVQLMKRAIYRRGLAIAEKYRPAAEAGDLDALGRLFCESSPCGGTLFEPAVDELEDGRTVLSMTGCPLLDAWRGLGLSEDEVDLMCEIAAAVDEGTFHGAGLELAFLDRRGRAGAEKCLLELRLPDE